jgi:hypothetical protein
MPPNNVIKPATKLVTVSRTFNNQSLCKGSYHPPKKLQDSLEPKQPWYTKTHRSQANGKQEAVVLSEEMAGIAPYAAVLPFEIVIKIMLFMLPRQSCVSHKFCRSWNLCKHTKSCSEGCHGLQLLFPKPPIALHINRYTRKICLQAFYSTEPMVFLWPEDSPGDDLAIRRIEGKRADNSNYLHRQLSYNDILNYKYLDHLLSPPVAMPILHRHLLKHIVLTNSGDHYVDNKNWTICMWPFKFNFGECSGLETVFLDFRMLSDPARRNIQVSVAVLKENMRGNLKSRFSARNLRKLTVAGVLSYRFAGDKQWARRMERGFGKGLAKDGELVFIDMVPVKHKETVAESSNTGQSQGNPSQPAAMVSNLTSQLQSAGLAIALAGESSQSGAVQT